MRRLAIIPNDPNDLYLKTGYGAAWLKAYYNPARFFDEVYSVAPYEQVDGSLIGVVPRPTPDHLLPSVLRSLGVQVLRAYGGAHPCKLACAQKVTGVPVVVSVHDTSPEQLHPSITDADVVLCVSNAVRDLVFTKFHRPDRVWMLPNRVDFTVMRPRGPEETRDLAARYRYRHPILHVGRRSHEKNLDNLIRALAILGDDYCIIAAGLGPVEEYRRVAAEERVLERCFFLDSIQNEELPRYFSFASCMCNPSRREAMSIVLIEALASGAALVASDIPATRESVRNGENGLLIKDVEDPRAIASAIRTACTDEGVRHRLRENSRPSVEHYERSRIDALEAEYYRRVLQLQADGAFRLPVGRRMQRSLSRVARNLVPTPIKNTLKPLIGA